MDVVADQVRRGLLSIAGFSEPSFISRCGLRFFFRVRFLCACVFVRLCLACEWVRCLFRVYVDIGSWCVS